jgi:hypothetical protein
MMVKIGFALFIILHGLVHLLYLGQSRRLFELQPGMEWPDGSWAVSRFAGDGTSRTMVAFFLGLVALGFVAGGVVLLAGLPWWRPLVAGSALLSSVIYLFFWDGKWQNAQDQGAIGLLINVALVMAVFLFQ